MDSDQDPELPEVEAPRKSRHRHGHGRNFRNTGESKSSGQGQIRSREQKSSPRTRSKSSKDSNAVDSTTKVYSNQNERREDVWSSISSVSTDEDELRTGLGADISRKGEAIAFAGPGHSHGYVIRVKRFAEPLSALGTAAKEPWVPAPGRTTRPRSAITATAGGGDQTKPKVAAPLKSENSHSHGYGGVGDELSPRQSKIRNNTNPIHRGRGNSNHRLRLLGGAARKDNLEKAGADAESRPLRMGNGASGPQSQSLTGYTLQGKDSLVDVAACLNARREEVLRLWQQNISNASLVEDVEKANQLAIEAGRDVAELRQSIQDLQQKPSLTPQDSEALNQLRNRILSKLEQFEETHAQIQLNLARLGKSTNAMSKIKSKSAAASASSANAMSMSTASANFAKTSRASQTTITDDLALIRSKPKPKNSSSTSLIYIADKSEQFQDDNDDDSENEAKEELMNNMRAKAQSTRVHPPEDEDEEDEVHETNLHNHHHVHVLRDLRSGTAPAPVVIAKRAQSLDRISEEKSKSWSRSRSKSSSIKAKVTQKHSTPKFEPELNNARKLYSRHLPNEEGADKQYLTTTSSTTMSEEFLADEPDNGSLYSSDNEDLRDREPQRRRPKAATAAVAALTSTVPSRENPGPDVDVNYYRHKLEKLHRQLLEQDTKYELLSRDVQKFESQSGFDLMLFKATVASRLEELEPYPELLAVTEKRLAETLQGKFVLEAELKARTQELSSAKNEIEKLTQESNDSKIRLEVVERKNAHLMRKIDKYRSVNNEYSQKIATLQQELDAIRRQAQAPPPPEKAGAQCHHAKAAIYEDRIAELKRELKKERRNVALLKDSKNSLTTRMAHRLQQLMIALEDSRARNRELVKQLRMIQTSYHDLFPSVQVPAMPKPKTTSTPRTMTSTSTTAAPSVAEIRRHLENLRFDHHGKGKGKIKTSTNASTRLKRAGIDKGRRSRPSKLELDDSIHNDLRENLDDEDEEDSKSNSESDEQRRN